MKDKCKTCEHDGDSSTEYCGMCDSVTSNWAEAGWIKDNKIKELRKALEEIAAYQMPRMRIKDNEVSITTISELCMCIQDMAGIANRVLGTSQKEQ